MHLWTEYEGRTIAEHYTLGKLLRSEGRNGFFATADKNGHPAVIRLTEAHYDEAEQLRRWRQVAEVHQDNLIEIEQVGQTTFEGVALTYALMEPDDANLGDVLKERPLTTAETLQVGKAVLAALQALHTSGLVHEHVEPANVLAVGETVKLRSDCVRECVVDGEFVTDDTCAELRRKDLHDFGILLLRCLTLETEWSPAHNNLPDPFQRVIPRALDGSWTLEQLGAALDPALFAAKPAGRPATTPSGVPSAAAAQASSAAAVSTPATAPNAATRGSAIPAQPLVPPSARVAPTETPITPRASAHSAETPTDPAVPVRGRFQPEITEPTHTPSRMVWVIGAIVLVAILLLGWHFLGSSKSAPTATNSRPAPVVNSGAVTPAVAPAPVAPTPAGPAVQSTAPVNAPAATEPPAGGGAGWYVIAFTYNHVDQAAHKAQRLRRNHDSLHPQVFSPSGHGPYLVALGGPYASQDEAEAVYRRARRAGLPRDTFVRHY